MVVEDLLYRADAARYLNTPEATLAQWAYRGIGPEYFKVGRRAMYRKSDLDRWLDSQRVVPGAS